MDAADRHDELVADSAPKCARLCKGEVMRVRWHAAAHKAWLPQYEFSVLLVAQANRLAQSTDCTSAWPLPHDSRSLLAPDGIGGIGNCPARDHTSRSPSRPLTRPARIPGVT